MSKLTQYLPVALLPLLLACGGSNDDSPSPPVTPTFPPHGTLFAVVESNAGFVAVGSGAEPLLLVSDDATSWEVIPAPRELGSLVAAAFGNQTLVAVGPGQSANSQIFTKPDGADWRVELDGQNLDSVLFGNGTFLISAGVEPGARVSSDGIDWTAISASGYFGFDGQRLVNSFVTAEGGGETHRLRVSSDGESWSEPHDAAVWPLAPMERVGGQILSFGRQCAGGDCAGDPVMLLGDAGTEPWELAPTAIEWNSFPTSIASNAERVVVVSPTTIRTTALPIGSQQWTEVEVESRDWTLVDVAYGGGRFIAVGRNGPKVLIATSADGEDWRDVLDGDE